MVAEWFSEVARRTGRLVALWMCVGFCHGVLNTDNSERGDPGWRETGSNPFNPAPPC
jgi:hypothetical protein